MTKVVTFKEMPSYGVALLCDDVDDLVTEMDARCDCMNDPKISGLIHSIQHFLDGYRKVSEDGEIDIYQ